MTRDCYFHILWFLHFTDNDNAPDPADPNRDKRWKIKPFLNDLLPRFTAVYAPSQNLSLDETLIKFKGRVQFRQFLPLKRSRFGLKGFVIADASTGYVLNTSIYTGKEGPAASKDLAMRVVLNLTEPYAHKEYWLFVDNWYTSVPCFLELERRSIHVLASGAVRSNRKFLPKEIVDQQHEQVKRLKRGDSLFRQSSNVIRCTWKDKKTVHLLSTIPEDLEIGQVERRFRSEGQWQTKNFTQPKLIKLYNSNMGGVDLSDQRITTCFRLMKGNNYLVLQNFLSSAWSSSAQCTHHVPRSWPPRCQPWWLQRVTCGTAHWRKLFPSRHLVTECAWTCTRCSF